MQSNGSTSGLKHCPSRSHQFSVRGKQYVVIASTGGGFFNNPVTDDSIVAFALDDSQ